MGPIRALVLGGTGAVGRNVVATLAEMPRVERVSTLGRRPVELRSPKLAQHVVDVFDPQSYAALLPGHSHALVTLGVGQPTKVSKEELWRVDYHCVKAFAEACRRAGVEYFSLMTSVESDAKAAMEYLRMKGRLEDEVSAMGFRRVSLFRPSMLLTAENRYGFSQGVLLKLVPLMRPVLAGPLRKYRGVRVEDLGAAMAAETAAAGEGRRVYEWDGFGELLGLLTSQESGRFGARSGK